MNAYPAARLDARNVGSTAGVDMGDGEKVFGTITAIHRTPENVLLFLADNEEPLELDHQDEVDIHLNGATLYALHTKNELERLREDLGALTDAILQLVPAAAPLLKAV